MDLIADILLLAGALTASLYCWVLSKRVKGLNDLDSGLGSAIASLSQQVNEMQSALKSAQAVTGSNVAELEDLVDRAESASEHLKLMLATTQEEKPSKARKTSRVSRLPKREEIKARRKPEPVNDPHLVEPETPRSAATKLQEDIKQKLLDRDDDARSRDELVETLQSILAANK